MGPSSFWSPPPVLSDHLPCTWVHQDAIRTHAVGFPEALGGPWFQEGIPASRLSLLPGALFLSQNHVRFGHVRMALTMILSDSPTSNTGQARGSGPRTLSLSCMGVPCLSACLAFFCGSASEFSTQGQPRVTTGILYSVWPQWCSLLPPLMWGHHVFPVSWSLPDEGQTFLYPVRPLFSFLQ